MQTTFILHGGFSQGNTDKDTSRFYREILKDAPEDAHVLLVCFAKDDERVAKAVERVTGKFNEHTWQKEIHIEVATRETLGEQLQKADIAYFHGGTTFKLLDALVTYPDLKNWLRGKIIAGESAGANVFCSTFYSPAANTTGSGLGFLPLRIVPHYSEKYAGVLDGIDEDAKLLLLPEYEYQVFEIDL